MEPGSDRANRIAGVLLGTAVGDALGLPREGISRRIFILPPPRHQFLFGHGMVSDDTEHACMVGQALPRAPEHVNNFARSLAWLALALKYAWRNLGPGSNTLTSKIPASRIAP